ncbi:phosphoethanolamine transferase [Polaromonas sp. A23]|nr:phosphoethanolamine transferase [Polaromonas sp. A23]
MNLLHRVTHVASRTWQAPRSPQFVVLVLSLWLLTVGNAALWLEIARLPHAVTLVPESITLGLLVFGLTAALLSLTAWTRFMKPVWIAILVIAGVAQHYMLVYGIMIDATMIGNTAQTDLREARDIVSWALLGNVLLAAALPVLWVARVPLVGGGAWRQLVRSTLLFLLALLITAGTAAAGYRLLAPFLRNNTQLRYMLNPLSTVAAAAVYNLKPLFKRAKGLVPVSADAALGASYATQQRRPLMLLVIGETARGDHFGLNGYERNTTPELATRDVVSFRNVRSCGTNTLASVPCMFSPLGKVAFEKRKMDHENLLDVLQAAGLAVLWLDNQAGCKGVCARIPSAQASNGLPDAMGRHLCVDGECLDQAMLYGLDARIAALDPQRSRKGVVVVMHQMGSHGPAYFKRSSLSSKKFKPECATSAISECPLPEVVNAYDNSIVETDLFLARAIDWLKSEERHFDTSLLYMSDHGESLGEYGLFLHGLPYALAPDAQKHVAFVGWFGNETLRRSNVDRKCLAGARDAVLTHDNLYHSVLGLLDVHSSSYQPSLDVSSACRSGAILRRQDG